jgi:hypothetical protein
MKQRGSQSLLFCFIENCKVNMMLLNNFKTFNKCQMFKKVFYVYLIKLFDCITYTIYHVLEFFAIKLVLYRKLIFW